jgi:hypothetical protein
MSKRKPYNDCAGYVASRRNAITGGWLVIYRAEEAGLDPSGGQWVTSCECHGTLCNHSSLPKARDSMKSPDFCEACQELARA